MADEHSTDTTVNATEHQGGKIVFDSQEDFDAVIERRLARVKKDYSDYNDLKAKVEELEKIKKEKEEADLSELQKTQKELDQLKLDLEATKIIAGRWELHEKKLLDRIEEESKDLQEEDLNILNAITDPDAKLTYINKIKSSEKPAPGVLKGRGHAGEITLEDVMEKRNKGDQSWVDDYKKIRKLS